MPIVTVALALCVALIEPAAQGRVKPAAALDPVRTIIDASRRAPVLAFGEDHGSAATHAFLRALIRDPRFAAAQIDVVVEFGNARYQDVLDRFIAGEEVAETSLQRVWNYTTVGKGVWGKEEIYPRLFREARAINAALPPEQRFRVLGGDPPVDWERADLGGFVRTRSEGVEWPTADERYDRDFHAAAVIREQVLARGRRALAIYGGHHMMRGEGMIRILEQRFGIRTFVIAAPTAHRMEDVEPSMRSWPIPSMTMVRDTALAPLDAGLLLFARRPQNTAGEYYDAILYLGPASSLTRARP